MPNLLVFSPSSNMAKGWTVFLLVFLTLDAVVAEPRDAIFLGKNVAPDAAELLAHLVRDALVYFETEKFILDWMHGLMELSLNSFDLVSLCFVGKGKPRK